MFLPGLPGDWWYWWYYEAWDQDQDTRNNPALTKLKLCSSRRGFQRKISFFQALNWDGTLTAMALSASLPTSKSLRMIEEVNRRGKSKKEMVSLWWLALSPSLSSFLPGPPPSRQVSKSSQWVKWDSRTQAMVFCNQMRSLVYHNHHQLLEDCLYVTLHDSCC